ncbi:MAG: N,N'-diacetylchitobiose phosphorylase, partial [Lachnospiraceae bacterium]|nr:N,N'-diacetylchitobiose phosphorylase [Lachnospiraceae bacterium]
VEGILGMRPDLHGLRVAPSIPSDWKEVTIFKNFRGKKLTIRIENPDGAQSGYKSLSVNGQVLEDNYIPESLLTEETEVVLNM